MTHRERRRRRSLGRSRPGSTRGLRSPRRSVTENERWGRSRQAAPLETQREGETGGWTAHRSSGRSRRRRRRTSGPGCTPSTTPASSAGRNLTPPRRTGQRARTRVSSQLQQGVSTGTAAASHDSPCELTAAAGVIHRERSCRLWPTWPATSEPDGQSQLMVS